MRRSKMKMIQYSIEFLMICLAVKRLSNGAFNKWCRNNQVFRVAVKTDFAYRNLIIGIETIIVCMVGNEIMQILFGCNGKAEDQQHHKSQNPPYDCVSSQIVTMLQK